MASSIAWLSTATPVVGKRNDRSAASDGVESRAGPHCANTKKIHSDAHAAILTRLIIVCASCEMKTTLAVRGESTNGRVASAGGPYARRGGAGDVGAYRRAAATKTQTDVGRLWRQRRLGQTAPRPGRGRA